MSKEMKHMKSPTLRAALVLAAIALTTAFAGAQDALGLRKARELALAKSATLRGAELAVDSASLAARAQGFAALPSLSASVGGAFDFGNATASQSRTNASTSASLQVSASQLVFDGGRVADLVKKYGLATEVAREALRSSRISLLGQTDAAFFALLEAQASVEAATSDLDAARQRRAIAQAKIDAGILSKSDFLQTEADTAGYETALTLARKTLSSARSRLASLTGLAPGTSLEQVDFAVYDGLIGRLGALDEASIDALAGAVTALAKDNSPTLRTYALSNGEAGLAIDMAKKALLPSLAAGFSQNLAYAASPGLTTVGSVSITASMSLDLWVAKNAIDSASLAEAQARLSGDQGQTDLELGLVQALYEWLASAASIGSSAKALEYAQGNYENALEKFKLSSATTSDLSTAEALVSADKTALIAARYGFLTNLSTLRGLAGLEDEGQLLALVP
jgi:outer membrane protein